MARKRPSSPVTPVASLRELRLFVARPTPSSARAEANLTVALEKFPGGSSVFSVTVIDVLQTPHQAVKDRIIVTPCLLVVGSHPPRTMVGDLTDTAALLLFLEHALILT